MKNIFFDTRQNEMRPLKGELYSFEKKLSGVLLQTQNYISQELLTSASEQVYTNLVEEAKKTGIKKIEKRMLSFRTPIG